MHKQLVRHHPAYALVAILLTSACVDEFEGSNVQVDFGAFIFPQARAGTMASALQLPANTHYRLYGLVDSQNGQPVVPPVLTELFRFEIHPIVDLASPCLIDPERTRFPGIHLSQFAARMAMDTKVTDVMNPPADATEEQLIDQSTAERRAINLQALARAPFFGGATDPGAVKAITSASTAVYPAVAPACVEDMPAVDPDLIPPPNCLGDDSARNRLRLCNAFWKANPGYYEGSDRILSLPLAGEYYGVALNSNPMNGSPIGGVQFQIPFGIREFTAFAFYAQFDDLNGDGEPDYPPGLPVNTIGFRQILLGRPSSPARGITRVQMANFEAPVPATLKAGLLTQMAVFSNLESDDLHF